MFNHKSGFFKKTVMITATLLLVAVVFSLCLVSCKSKQIPVYQGMTVSNGPEHQADSGLSAFRFLSMYATASHGFEVLEKDDHGHHDDHHKKEDESDGGGSSDIQVNSEGMSYYAKPNEDFYVTVHIDNPEKFEIVSFTLNGEKYSSYMFEVGSDMENLILKCNAGDAAGIVEYTIDAIKYIDGTDIKDVQMKGNRTVKVGVYTENQPVASVTEVERGFDKIVVDVTVSDPVGLLNLPDSEINAVLYRGDTVIDSKPIESTETTRVSFENLKHGTQYSIAIAADYDALDGTGKSVHNLSVHSVSTEAVVSVEISDISYTEASYKLVWHKDALEKNIISITLTKENATISEITEEEGRLTNLNADKEYTLIIVYSYEGKTNSHTTSFSTLERPLAEIDCVTESDVNSITVDVLMKDPLNLSYVEKIELLYNGEIIATQNACPAVFTDLEALKTYDVKVFWSMDTLDFNGGNSIITYIDDYKCITQSKGLEISNGMVTGIGSCTDREIYVNMPIADSAFRENTFITSVNLGGGVIRIKESAFRDCTALKKVNIHEGVTAIDPLVFWGCEKLCEVKLPDTLKTIGAEAFCGCISLSTVTLPDSLTSLGLGVFKSSGLTSIVIPESITTLSEGLFHSCYELTDVTLPDTLKTIESNVFGYCRKIDVLVIPDGVKTIGSYAFDLGPHIIYIPESVESMGEWNLTRDDQIALAKVSSKPKDWKFEWIINENATVIWNAKGVVTDSQGVSYVELNDDKLIVLSFDNSSETVILPDSVIRILPQAFASGSLKSITLPESVEEIGEYAFAYCALEEIVIPGKVKTIGRFAFVGCSLKKVVFNEGLVTIEEHAFEWNQNLTDINLPQTLTTIEREAFKKCDLKTVVLNEGLVSIGESAFAENCSLTDINFPSTLKTIENGAFHMCDFKTLVFNEGLTSIGGSAFVANYSLSEITLPSTLTTIGERAFEACNLIEIFIPENVTTIGENAFGDNPDRVIRCEALRKPSGWHIQWAGPDFVTGKLPTIVWGYTDN